MNKPTLLFVEEVANNLSKKVISRVDIQVVLLRFGHGMGFDSEYLRQTAHIPSFVFDKGVSIEIEVERFRFFCLDQGLKIEYFYNDSEYNQEIVQRFASMLGLQNSLTEHQSLCVRDKIAMKDMLNGIGLKTMAYQELVSIDDAIGFSETHGFPMIVKWRKGLSSKEVYKVENIRELRGLGLDYGGRRFMAESFCNDLIWCLDALIQNGKVVRVFLAWLPYTNLSFAEYKEKFAQITVDDVPEDIKFDSAELVQAIIDDMGLRNGYMHLETFVDIHGKPTICEFAWRTPGEHMLLNHSVAFGIDVYGLLIDIMVGKKIELSKSKVTRCVGDMFLPVKKGTIKKISNYHEMNSLEGVIAGEVRYGTGDVIEPKRQYTDSAGWIQVEGVTKEEVLKRMLKVYDAFEMVVD